MNITLVIFRFDPMVPSDVEFAVVDGELPRIPIKASEEPQEVLSRFVTRCVNILPGWASIKLVTFTRNKDGLTCVYKLSLPNNINASTSFTWVKYDQLDKFRASNGEPVEPRDREIVVQCYHTA